VFIPQLFQLLHINLLESLPHFLLHVLLLHYQVLQLLLIVLYLLLIQLHNGLVKRYLLLDALYLVLDLCLRPSYALLPCPLNDEFVEEYD
jgi:hypothetical protein